MLFRSIIIGIFLLMCNAMYSQHSHCGFGEMLKTQIRNDPGYQKKLAELEKNLVHHNRNKSDTIITIPVVFHVVYRTEAQNISNNQIISQLEILNKDYRLQNSDTGLVDDEFPKADAKIEFCFAGKDTNSMDFSGVTRTMTNQSQIGQNSNQLFQLQPVWDSRKYLNIYICEIGGGNAGYSSYPGGNPARDAVVIDYTNFGAASLDPNYNLGRTVTHEVGHWLGLYHIWGINQADCNDDDLVQDTPNQGKVYTACPQGSQFSCGTQDMTSNYMGYVYDRCMAAFTPGQVQRMRSMIAAARPILSSTIPCSTNPIQKDTVAEVFPIKVFPNPSEGHVYVSKRNASLSQATFKLFSVDGKEVQFKRIASGKMVRIELVGLKAGIYLLQIKNGSDTTVEKICYKGY